MSSKLKVNNIIPSTGTQIGISTTGGGINLLTGTVVTGIVTASGFDGPITQSGDFTIDDYIVHAGDSNTKFGFLSNDVFEVHTAGAERIRVEADGHTQIGGVGLSGGNDHGLTVTEPGGTANVLELATTNALGRINFSRNLSSTLNTTSYIQWGEPGAQGTGDLKFGTSPASNSPVDRLHILSGGGVGIGASLYHLGDTNTFLNFGTDTMTLKTGGSTRIYLDNNHPTWIRRDAAGISTTGLLLNYTAGTGVGVGLAFAPTQNYDSRFASIEVVNQDGNNNMYMAFKTVDASQNHHGIERLRITSTGSLGTNATVRAAYGGLDLCSQGASNFGTLTLGAGGGQNGQSRTANQENQFRIMSPTYANPSNMFTVMYGASGSSLHEINYGGGTGWAYAANLHRFFTASNKTTPTGTETLKIENSAVTINGTTDGVLNLNTTDSRGSFIRFQQAGTTRVWVGSGHGLSLGDDDDLGLRATDKIRFWSVGSEKLIIDGGQVRHGHSNVLGGGLDSVRVNNGAAYRGTVLRGTGGSGGMANHDEYCFLFNRMGTDGDIIHYYAQGSKEGSISVSGSSVSYNGGVLTRWSQLVGISTNVKSDRPTIYQGTVMSNLDEMCEWTDEDNMQLNKTQVSTASGDKNVAGVFWAWDDDDDVYTNDFYIAQTGDFIIRVGAATTITRGDLLESAGDGTAKPQSDDIVRSKTVAKVTSGIAHTTYADGSKTYPCVIMAS